MKTLQELQKDGIDIDGAMERFMENEEMFRYFLRQLPAEDAYYSMLQALNEKNVEAAFDWAHRLKGITANLALPQLYEELCKIVEILRDGELPDAGVQQHFIKLYEDTMEYICKEV